MKIKKYMDSYLTKHSDDIEKREELSNFIEKFFCEMDEEYEDVKEAFIEELGEFVEEVDEEMLVAILENIKKKDGTRTGIKWTKEETNSVANQYDVKTKVEAAGKKYDPVYYWFAMNYVYAVHNNANRTLNGYVELAVDELCNKNICFHDVIKKIFKKL